MEKWLARIIFGESSIDLKFNCHRKRFKTIILNGSQLTIQVGGAFYRGNCKSIDCPEKKQRNNSECYRTRENELRIAGNNRNSVKGGEENDKLQGGAPTIRQLGVG